MTVNALVPQCSVSVLSYSECKIAKIFWGFAPGPHWGGFTVAPNTPQTPKKFLDTALAMCKKNPC